MRLDVPSAGRLRGQDPIDLMSALTPVVEALRASDTDLSRVRVVCDWIQYRASFREPVDYRPVLAAGWQAGPDPGSPGRLAAAGAGPPETALEIAVDLRRAGADLGPQVIRLLAEHASPGGSARLPLAGLDLYQIGPYLTGETLRTQLESGGDVRMHVNNGALSSFADTLPLLHPFGRLLCHDLFVMDIRDYGAGFYGPGKYDGSVVNWVNGPLLRHVGSRGGFDVRISPFAQRPAANVKTLTATVRE